jgi:hydroxymethylpyrimidine pyrophosphatase-like HAD family hydrolase
MRVLRPETIKALALDLDGTALLPGNIFSRRTLDALKACMKRDIKIIISTGRSVEAAEKYRAVMETEGPMVYFNGAEVVDMPSRKILSASLLAPEAAVFCTELSRSMGIHFQVFLPGKPGDGKKPLSPEFLLIEKESPEADMYRGHTGLVPVTGDIIQAVSAPGCGGCIKGMFITDPSIHEVIREKLNRRFGNSVAVVRSYPTFLEVMRAGVSKGEGLKTAMTLRGLEAGEVIALGDEENDLPMFGAAGFAAAPANAGEKVKKAADIVIGANSEDGVAAFIEKTFL